MRKVGYLVFCLLLVLTLGFDFSRHSVPLEEIHDGGPPKDGIPALYDPEFISAEEAVFLMPDDRVLGLVIDGEAKAYPLRILNWHELVNDRVGGQAVLISFCPLCGTGLAFDANLNGRRKLFGVSGKLYNSNVLFYDRETESLWSQIKMEAVTGSFTGTRLVQISLAHTSWRGWSEKYPDTKVLSLRTGYQRSYDRSPYRTYDKSNVLYFPVSHEDDRLERKAWVLGVTVNGVSKAYPVEALEDAKPPFSDHVGGEELTIHFDSRNRSAWAEQEGRVIPTLQAYWFAWAAFHPETALYE